MESAFNHVGREFANAAAFSDGQGDSVRYFNDLRELVSFCGGHVQGRGPRELVAATGDGVRSARDGDRVVSGFAEEVSEADSVDGAELLKVWSVGTMRSVSSLESSAVDRLVCAARRARVMFFAVRSVRSFRPME